MPRESMATKSILSRTFSPTQDQGLDDHRIDKVAVLPGVIGVELMQQAGQFVLGQKVSSLRDVQFRTPVKFFHDRLLQVDVEVTRQTPSESAPWLAEMRIATSFVSPVGRTQRREHFVARVPSDDAAPTPMSLPSLRTLAREPRSSLTREDIYRRYFHGPSFRVLDANPRFGDDGIVASTMPSKENGQIASRPLL